MCNDGSLQEVPYKLTPQGTVIWEDEFEFTPPPPDGNWFGWNQGEILVLGF